MARVRPVGPGISRGAVSELTASRLSLYLRCLSDLEAEGATHVSSSSLARRFDLNAAQIRKDLAIFGEFGVRGVGYEVGTLKRHLLSILGLDQTRKVAIVGAGHLGQALADSGGFAAGGFRIAALFDDDPQKVGSRTRGGLVVQDVRRLREVVAREGIEIGVITVPAAAAQEVARRCAAAGLRALLNFAPARLTVPADVRVKNVDLKVHLETLCFYMPRA
ncbi:MAG: redox-sensing transcriptional repressor Rex [Thermoanaerobaculia bacterium]